MNGLWLWPIAMSVAAFLAFARDKRLAQTGARRIPETTLLSLAILGGSPGALLGMVLCRHKTKKPAFAVGVPVILLAGTVSPVDNMPEFLQYVAEINPLHHFINITLGIFLKHMSLAAVGVLLAKITAIAVCSVSIAIWMFTRRA